MYTKENKVYSVYYSKDDKTYEKAEVFWEEKETDCEKQHFYGTAKNLTADVKYIMIDISEGFNTYWCAYEALLCGVTVKGK